MNTRQLKALERLKRIRAWCGTFPPDTDRGRRLVAELENTIEIVTRLQSRQRVQQVEVSTYAEVGERLRMRLRVEHMLRLSREALPLFRDVPGVAKALKVPHATKKGSVLVDAALRMDEALRPHLRFLRAEGFAPGVLVALRKAAREVKRWETEAPKKLGQQKAATAELRRQFSASVHIVRGLEGIAMAKRMRDPGAWDLWLKSKKEPARTGRPPKSRTVASSPG